MLIVTGLFFNSPYVWGTGLKRHHPSHGTPETASKEECAQYLLAPLKVAIAASSQNFISADTRPPGHFGPYWCTVTGEPDIKPPDRYFNHKVKYSNPHYKERSRKGEIVVAPYAVFSNHLSYTLGFNASSSTPWGTEDFTLDYDGPALGKEREHDPSTGWDWWRSDGSDYISMSCKAPLVRETRSYGVSPYSVGWSDDPFEDVDSNLYSPNILSNIVTETLAEANRVTVDLLTALAEAPETVMSIFSACIFMKKKFFAAKANELRFLNLVKKGDDYAVRLAKKNLKETGDAASHVWLAFRYAIMPNVYLIEDIIKALDNGERVYTRWRTARSRILTDLEYNIPAPPTGWVREGTVTCLDRVMIKRAFKQASVMNEFSSIPLVTAWELVPLSFVIDWFLNIGDLCAAFSNPQGISQQGATYSWNIEGNYIYTHTATKAMVAVEHKAYHRVVISPSDYCQLSWQPQLNTSRIIDSMALIWRAIT